MRYTVNANTFTQLPYTTGTVQNISNTDVEISNEQVLGSGIILKAGEFFSFDKATVYVAARPVLDDGTGIISVVPFNAGGRGGESPIYVPKGSIAFASLPTTLDSTMLGWTYNISDAFMTDSRFVEGADIDYPAGENVVVVEPTSGIFKYDCFGGAYILPVATDSVLGGVKSSNADGKVAVANDGVMSINLPTASTTVKGGIKIGDSFDVSSDTLLLNVGNTTVVGGVKSSATDGDVSINNDGTMTINLPTASASVKGGIMVGTGLEMSSDTLNLSTASTTVKGGVKVGTGLEMSSDTLNLSTASDTVKGGIKVGGGLDITNDVLSVDIASASVVGGVKSSSADGDVTVNNDGTMSLNKLFYRKANTAYAVGDTVYHNALATSQKLVCVKAGTTANSALTLGSTDEGTYITDGTAAWCIDSFADGNYSAIHQNGIGRGADITAYWDSGDMSTNIQAGKFVGMHIGDYITKTVSTAATTYTDKSGTEVNQAAATYSNAKWLIGAFDPHIHCGDTETTAHHILLISASTLRRNVTMNPTNDTTGGYLGSDMWTVHMPIWATAVKNAFGSTHVLKHRELLSNAINATAGSAAGANFVGTTSGCSWTDVEVNIPNESMVYGKIWGSSGHEGGDFPRMLPLYALKCSHLDDRSWFWLRSVSSASEFAFANSLGDAYYRGASGAGGNGGIRPYFLAY